MSKLTIRGSVNRGHEVIGLLEKLGGKNNDNYKGSEESWVYFIGENYKIEWEYYKVGDNSLTIEEFSEKFPYRIADSVMVNGVECFITDWFWHISSASIRYKVFHKPGSITNGYYETNQLEPCPDKENVDERSVEYAFDKEIISFETAEKDKYELELGDYKIKVEDGKTYVVRKKMQYPKTFEECCRIVNASPDIKLMYDTSKGQAYAYDIDNLQIYNHLRRLSICHEAYWKVVAQKIEMGEHVNMEEIGEKFREDFKDLVEKCEKIF